MENAPDTLVNQTIAWGWVVMIISLAFFFTGFASAQYYRDPCDEDPSPYATPPVAIDGEPTAQATDSQPEGLK
jgi:hypothetical protein